MVRLNRSDSLASLNEASIEKILTQKTNNTDKICAIINYTSFLPSVIYNLAWIFILKGVFEELENNDSFFEEIKSCEECVVVCDAINRIFIWVVIFVLKNIFFIIFAKVLCERGDDCNILCLVVKSVTSFFPSVYLTYDLDLVSSIKENSFSISNIRHKENLANILFYVKKYYTLENYYVSFFTILLILIPLGSILMALKELWKSKNYVSCKNQ